jgi:hypothetical protein
VLHADQPRNDEVQHDDRGDRDEDGSRSAAVHVAMT